MEQNKQSEMIRAALENVKSMFDANTITGTPMELKNGVLIVPVSKIQVGVVSGGMDYQGKSTKEITNYGGGGGYQQSAPAQQAPAPMPQEEDDDIPF